jgi:CheY-like chemotaxis protein
MSAPLRVLVLDDDPHTLDGVTELLRSGGYEVAPAATYESAKSLMDSEGFDLLIADVRLRGFNGLRLVQQCRQSHPSMSLMVLTGSDEALTEIEARRHGARFLHKPIQASRLLDEVAESLAHLKARRRWPRTAVPGGFRARGAGRDAAVMEVGYGGMCVELAGRAPVPPTFDVEVAAIGLVLPVRTVWLEERPASVVCRVALVSDTTAAAITWRTVVDRLSA